MKSINLEDLTLEQMSQWPLFAKISSAILLHILILLIGYWFVIKANCEQLDTLQIQEATLKSSLDNKKKQAANLITYRKELQVAKERFNTNQNRPKQPLEQFPLASLKFVGTLKQDNEIWALIKRPDQQLSLIKVGQYMGQHYGKVLLIKNNLIQLEETKTWENSVTTIRLHSRSKS